MGASYVLPESGYAQWQVLKFGADATDPLIAGPDANPDKDLLVNLLEYAFDLDPNISSNVGIPYVGNSGGFLTLIYRRLVGVTDIEYVVEWSTNLIDWHDTGVTEELVTPQGAGLTEEVLGKVPADVPRKFIRLSVRPL